MARKPTYIRAWRKKRGFSLDEVVGRLEVIGVPMTGASLSRIERGLQPYSQDILEPLAEALNVEEWQLLRDNPEIPLSPVADFVARLGAEEAKQAEKVLHAMFDKRA